MSGSAPGTDRLADFAAEWWELYAGRHLSISTLDTYKSIWNVHVNPRLGHLELRQITPLTLERFAAELADDGVGAPTIRKAMSMLQGMLGRAVAWNRLRTNPAPAAKKPAAPRQRAIQPLAPITIEKLRHQLLGSRRDGLRDAMLVSLLAYSGERPEEALALEWRHVRANTLLIEQKLVRGQIVAGQKTNRSIRTIKLLEPLAHDLAEYRAQTRGTGLLFPKPDGGAWLDHDFRNWRKRSLRPATEAIGLVAARPYDLRHYAHLIAETAGQPPIAAERAIETARAELGRK